MICKINNRETIITFRKSDNTIAPSSSFAHMNPYQDDNCVFIREDTDCNPDFQNYTDMSETSKKSWKYWVKEIVMPVNKLPNILRIDKTIKVYYNRKLGSEKISIPLYITRFGIYNEDRKPLLFCASNLYGTLGYASIVRVNKLYIDNTLFFDNTYDLLLKHIQTCFYNGFLGYDTYVTNQLQPKLKVEVCDLEREDIYDKLRLGTLRVNLNEDSLNNFFKSINVNTI